MKRNFNRGVLDNESTDLFNILVDNAIPLVDKYWLVCQKSATREENQKIAMGVAEIIAILYCENNDFLWQAKSYLKGNFDLKKLEQIYEIMYPEPYYDYEENICIPFNSEAEEYKDHPPYEGPYMDEVDEADGIIKKAKNAIRSHANQTVKHAITCILYPHNFATAATENAVWTASAVSQASEAYEKAIKLYTVAENDDTYYKDQSFTLPIRICKIKAATYSIEAEMLKNELFDFINNFVHVLLE